MYLRINCKIKSYYVKRDACFARASITSAQNTFHLRIQQLVCIVEFNFTRYDNVLVFRVNEINLMYMLWWRISQPFVNYAFNLSFAEKYINTHICDISL